MTDEKWLELLPEVGGPILRRLNEGVELLKKAAELDCEAQAYRSAARAVFKVLEARITANWTEAEIAAAKEESAKAEGSAHVTA